jgi:hypothetical protein
MYTGRAPLTMLGGGCIPIGAGLGTRGDSVGEKVGGLKDVDPLGPEGTVWNALVTSEADIRAGGAKGGGVPSSSSFAS